MERRARTREELLSSGKNKGRAQSYNQLETFFDAFRRRHGEGELGSLWRRFAETIAPGSAPPQPPNSVRPALLSSKNAGSQCFTWNQAAILLHEIKITDILHCRS